MSIHDATTHLFLHDAREHELAQRAAEVRLRNSLVARSRGRRGGRARIVRAYRWVTIASTRRGARVAR
jgi:hypothetical protein